MKIIIRNTLCALCILVTGGYIGYTYHPGLESSAKVEEPSIIRGTVYVGKAGDVMIYSGMITILESGPRYLHFIVNGETKIISDDYIVEESK